MTKRILVVDDSPTDMHLICNILTQAGYDHLVANNSKIAFAMAKEEKPDAILMDIVMPGQSGYQIIRKLREDPITANIPVIFTSSKNKLSDKAWGLRQGAVDYFTKPVSGPKLLTKLQELIGASDTED